MDVVIILLNEQMFTSNVVAYIFDRSILGTEAVRDQESFRERLFNAVSERDVTRLYGVKDYLLRNSKLLSDSVCK